MRVTTHIHVGGGKCAASLELINSCFVLFLDILQLENFLLHLEMNATVCKVSN